MQNIVFKDQFFGPELWEKKNFA